MKIPKPSGVGKWKVRANAKQKSSLPTVLATLDMNAIPKTELTALQAIPVTPEQRAAQLRRFQKAARHFAIFDSLFQGLAGFTFACPSLYSGSAVDTIPLLTLRALAKATAEAIREVAEGIECDYAVDRATEIEREADNPFDENDPDTWPRVPCIITKNSQSRCGRHLPPGCRVFDTNGQIGRVLYVADDIAAILVEHGQAVSHTGSVLLAPCAELVRIEQPATDETDVLAIYKQFGRPAKPTKKEAANG